MSTSPSAAPARPPSSSSSSSLAGNTGVVTGSKAAITVAAMAAALMSVLDISIVNVGLTNIRASFGTPLDQIAWVSTGYAMANITVIPMSGFLQRRFGIRRYFTASIVLFTFASVLCGISWNLPSLVAFRILQGIGGGAIIPTAQATLFARWPREQAGIAGALFGLGAITGPLLGPTIGGVLIEHLSWHWMFLVNVPIGSFAAFLVWTQIKEEGFEPDLRPIDVKGIGLLAVGMISLQFVLEEGNREGWFDSTEITLVAIVAVTSLITFVVHELEVDSPVVDFRVFAAPGYAAATLLNFLIGTVLFAGSFLYSLFSGTVMHLKAIDIGSIFLHGSWIQLLLLPIVGATLARVDPRKFLVFGLAMVTLSTVLNAGLTPLADIDTMTMPIFVRAIGLSFCFVPLTVVAMSGVRPDQRGSASGLFNATRELGGSIGTAWMSTRLADQSKQHAAYLAESVSTTHEAAVAQLAAIKGGMTGQVADPLAAATAQLAGRVQLQGLSMAFSDGFSLLAVLFAFSLIVPFFLKRADPTVDRTAAH